MIVAKLTETDFDQLMQLCFCRLEMTRSFIFFTNSIQTIDKKNSMHKDNRALFFRILPFFNANILGIDAIFEKGIEISHKEPRVIFLEVNSRPYLKMHDYPRYGKKQDLSRYYEVLNQMEIQQEDIY